MTAKQYDKLLSELATMLTLGCLKFKSLCEIVCTEEEFSALNILMPFTCNAFELTYEQKAKYIFSIARKNNKVDLLQNEMDNPSLD